MSFLYEILVFTAKPFSEASTSKKVKRMRWWLTCVRLNYEQNSKIKIHL